MSTEQYILRRRCSVYRAHKHCTREHQNIASVHGHGRSHYKYTASSPSYWVHARAAECRPSSISCDGGARSIGHTSISPVECHLRTTDRFFDNITTGHGLSVFAMLSFYSICNGWLGIGRNHHTMTLYSYPLPGLLALTVSRSSLPSSCNATSARTESFPDGS